jgi:probable selenium-dependent hydroxylase accessory protein YqeC
VPDGKTETLKEAFDIQPGEVISLVGAGGKTTLMFALARELFTPKGLVINTTTTKIFSPSSFDAPHLLISHEEKEIVDFILNNGTKYDHITVVSEEIVASGKLRGVSPELITILSKLGPVTCTIVEADGAAQRPLKAPDADFEPVIPYDTSLVIPVVGIDALGRELREEYVFRSKIASELTGTTLGGIISLDTVALLVTHPSGMTCGSPVHARIVPFINKTDLNVSLSEARKLASKILEERHPKIDRVVLGQAQLQPPVREVIAG